MNLYYKPGVRIRGSCVEILEGVLLVASVLNEFGYDCIITGGVEGSHSETSLHYAGAARDFSSKYINRKDLFKVRDEIKSRFKALGDFDFILEDFNTSNEHFHLEWQPKKSAGYLNA